MGPWGGQGSGVSADPPPLLSACRESRAAAQRGVRLHHAGHQQPPLRLHPRYLRVAGERRGGRWGRSVTPPHPAATPDPPAPHCRCRSRRRSRWCPGTARSTAWSPRTSPTTSPPSTGSSSAASTRWGGHGYLPQGCPTGRPCSSPPPSQHLSAPLRASPAVTSGVTRHFRSQSRTSGGELRIPFYLSGGVRRRSSRPGKDRENGGRVGTPLPSLLGSRGTGGGDSSSGSVPTEEKGRVSSSKGQIEASMEGNKAGTEGDRRCAGCLPSLEAFKARLDEALLGPAGRCAPRSLQRSWALRAPFRPRGFRGPVLPWPFFHGLCAALPVCAPHFRLQPHLPSGGADQSDRSTPRSPWERPRLLARFHGDAGKGAPGWGSGGDGGLPLVGGAVSRTWALPVAL